MTQLTAKRTKELLDILEDTKEAMFKDHKTDHPHTQWEHKRTQIKQRPTNSPTHPPSRPNHNHRRTKTRTKTQTRPRKERQPLLNHTVAQQIQPHNRRAAKLFPPHNR